MNLPYAMLLTRLFLPYLLFCMVPLHSSGQTMQVTVQSNLADGEVVVFYYVDEFRETQLVRLKKSKDKAATGIIAIPSQDNLLLKFTKNGKIYPVRAKVGETITVEHHSSELIPYHFKGDSEQELNFFAHLEINGLGMGIGDTWGQNWKGRLDTKFIMFESKYQQRLNFLEKAKDSLGISNDFYRFMKNEIASMYILALTHPYWVPNLTLDNIPHTLHEELNRFQQSGWFYQSKYQPVSDTYHNALYSFNRYLSREKLGTPDAFTAQYASAMMHFQGAARDRVLFYFIKQHMGKGHPNFEALVHRFSEDCTYAPYVAFIDSVRNAGKVFAFDAELKKNPLIDLDDKYTTWGQILEENKGKVLYIDFWASWCKPCIREFPYSKKVSSQLAGKDVVFLTISIDADLDAWKTAAGKYGLEGIGYQNYQLRDDSELARFLKVPSVPRYVLIDKAGKVVAMDAKRPSDSKLLPEILKLL